MINKKEYISTGKEGTKKLDRDKSDKKEIEGENLALRLLHLQCLVLGLPQTAKVLGVDFDVNNFK